ncbi:hypothetical protein B0H14DRAFT_2735929 [Mycena olivaceomarginata]|nr:hypothetical protein B0H14DRAFT_2735929 [Mycena olivaceomarginata]
MLIWRCLISIPATTARLQSFLFSVSCDRGLQDSVKSHIKAHPVYPELKALGTELCLDEMSFLRPYIDIDLWAFSDTFLQDASVLLEPRQN